MLTAETVDRADISAHQNAPTSCPEYARRSNDSGEKLTTLEFFMLEERKNSRWQVTKESLTSSSSLNKDLERIYMSV